MQTQQASKSVCDINSPHPQEIKYSLVSSVEYPNCQNLFRQTAQIYFLWIRIANKTKWIQVIFLFQIRFFFLPSGLWTSHITFLCISPSFGLRHFFTLKMCNNNNTYLGQEQQWGSVLLYLDKNSPLFCHCCLLWIHPDQWLYIGFLYNIIYEEISILVSSSYQSTNLNKYTVVKPSQYKTNRTKLNWSFVIYNAHNLKLEFFY